MMTSLLSMLSVTFLAILSTSVAAGPEEEVDLAAAAETYCFAAEGNHARTWDRVEQDGFRPLNPADFPNLRLPGARGLRGYAKRIGSVEVRVLTAENRFRGFGQGTNFFRMCWVSAEPGNRRQVDSVLRRTLGVDRFRQDDALVYAWATLPDGRTRSVGRREFGATGLRDSLAQDMRFVITGGYGEMVSIAYMVPAAGFSEAPASPLN